MGSCLIGVGSGLILARLFPILIRDWLYTISILVCVESAMQRSSMGIQAVLVTVDVKLETGYLEHFELETGYYDSFETGFWSFETGYLEHQVGARLLILGILNMDFGCIFWNWVFWTSTSDPFPETGYFEHRLRTRFLKLGFLNRDVVQLFWIWVFWIWVFWICGFSAPELILGILNSIWYWVFQKRVWTFELNLGIWNSISPYWFF